jgi:multiple antibiotic resistance protein
MTPETSELGVPLARLFGLLFMMMGPVAVMSAFVGITAGADPSTRRRIAVRAALYSTVALLLAVSAGYGVLNAWGASRASLVLAAGLLLLFASLGQVLGGWKSALPAKPEPHRIPGLEVAISPLAFPTIVAPHAVGVLVIFASFFRAPAEQGLIAGVALAIILLNLLAMFVAHRFVPWIGDVPLRILGAVFGVLQVALGIEFMLSGIRMAWASN